MLFLVVLVGTFVGKGSQAEVIAEQETTKWDQKVAFFRHGGDAPSSTEPEVTIPPPIGDPVPPAVDTFKKGDAFHPDKGLPKRGGPGDD